MRRFRRFDFGFAAIVVAIMALAWILTLAGTAFAVRVTLILCFATLAGRARRIGAPARRPVPIRRRR
jgi:membrane protease YdiL (CAAX protease family)